MRGRCQWDSGTGSAREHVHALWRWRAKCWLQKHAAKGQIVTGLLFVDPESDDLHANLDTVDAPLNTLDAGDLCPGSAAL